MLSGRHTLDERREQLAAELRALKAQRLVPTSQVYRYKPIQNMCTSKNDLCATRTSVELINPTKDDKEPKSEHEPQTPARQQSAPLSDGNSCPEKSNKALGNGLIVIAPIAVSGELQAELVNRKNESIGEDRVTCTVDSEENKENDDSEKAHLAQSNGSAEGDASSKMPPQSLSRSSSYAREESSGSIEIKTTEDNEDLECLEDLDAKNAMCQRVRETPGLQELIITKNSEVFNSSKKKGGNVSKTQRGNTRCKECNMSFAKLSRLYQHQRLLHGKQSRPKRHKCVECEKGFESHRALGDHLNTHSGNLDMMSSCSFGYMNGELLLRCPIICIMCFGFFKLELPGIVF